MPHLLPVPDFEFLLISNNVRQMPAVVASLHPATCTLKASRPFNQTLLLCMINCQELPSSLPLFGIQLEACLVGDSSLCFLLSDTELNRVALV